MLKSKNLTAVNIELIISTQWFKRQQHSYYLTNVLLTSIRAKSTFKPRQNTMQVPSKVFRQNLFNTLGKSTILILFARAKIFHQKPFRCSAIAISADHIFWASILVCDASTRNLGNTNQNSSPGLKIDSWSSSFPAKTAANLRLFLAQIRPGAGQIWLSLHYFQPLNPSKKTA